MPSKQPTTNSQLPERLYGEHYPDSFLDVSRPVRESNVSTLGDYIRRLQEVGKQSDKPCVACEPPKSGFEHICPNNPILTCNCADPNACAELGSDPDACAELGSDPDGNTVDGNKRCPDSGKLCNERSCPDECLGDEDRCPNHDGFADNIDYTGIPYPKGKAAVRGWPCVVVGALPEAWDSTTECVSRGEHSSGNTERHTDAGHDYDGYTKTAGL